MDASIAVASICSPRQRDVSLRRLMGHVGPSGASITILGPAREPSGTKEETSSIFR